MEAYKKLEALQGSEAFEKEMAAAETLEQLQEILKNHGVELSAKELEEMAAKAAAAGELSADDLDAVAGGGGVIYNPVPPFISWLIKWWIRRK